MATGLTVDRDDDREVCRPAHFRYYYQIDPREPARLSFRRFHCDIACSDAIGAASFYLTHAFFWNPILR